jgi:hypothetical protein
MFRIPASQCLIYNRAVYGTEQSLLLLYKSQVAVPLLSGAEKRNLENFLLQSASQTAPIHSDP